MTLTLDTLRAAGADGTSTLHAPCCFYRSFIAEFDDVCIVFQCDSYFP